MILEKEGFIFESISFGKIINEICLEEIPYILNI